MADSAERAPGARWLPAGIGLAAGAASFALGWAVLAADHPADDAYILFRYAEHVAEGHGSVFNVGGPRAEGATDFLWLMTLAAGVRAGLDVALAALLLNALGAAALAFWLARSALAARAPVWARAALVPLALTVVVGPAAMPSYVGFSTFAYAALFVGLAGLAAAPDARTLWCWPVLGLALGLFRPDGVVVGVAYSALGLWHAQRLELQRRYWVVLALCGALGAAYFLARAAYFGLWLPLPLYVKSHADAAPLGAGWLAQLQTLLPGLESNWRWLRSRGATPLPLLVALAALLFALRRSRSREVRDLVLTLVPPALLIAVLSVGVQSQNVGFRFQAPVALAALLVLARAAALALEAFPSPHARSLVVIGALAATAASSLDGAGSTGQLIRREARTYLPSFAVMLGARLEPDALLAVTEAGAVPFWSHVRAEDIVGLNNPRLAREAPRVADVRALDPDLVFFHHAYTLDGSLLQGEPASPAVLRLSREALPRALLPRYRDLYALESPGHDERGLQPTRTAALVLARFLAESDAYEIVAVDYRGRGGYEHIYGLRRGWDLAPSLLELLIRTKGGEIDISYLEARAMFAQPGFVRGSEAPGFRTGSR
jgi:hypothetical protein